MNCCPTLRRWLAGLATVAILAAAVAVAALSGGTRDPKAPGPDDGKELNAADAKKGDWPMFGGSLQRNMVNAVDKNVPTEWDVKKKTNVKWVVELGSKAYGGPIVSGGKVFIGTNNDRPRNPRDTSPDPEDPEKKVAIDKGIVMCFDEATGKFLWQAVHDKLAAGRVNDWPREGICSSPTVEGDRLYYVSNRCEVICASVNGYEKDKDLKPTMPGYTETADGKKDAGVIWRLDMIGKLGVFPHNLAVCSPLLVGDTLFVITSNGVDEDHIKIPQPAAPSFLALDKKSGEVKWSSRLPTEQLLKPGANLEYLKNTGRLMMHGQWSNPVYAEVSGVPQIIFPGGDGWLRGFNPKSGEVIWQFDCNPKNSFYALGGKGTRSDFIASPVVHDNKLYIGVGQDPEHDAGVGHFWCIDLKKANEFKGDVSPELPVEKEKEKGKPNPNSALAWQYGGLDPKDPRGYKFGRTMSTASVSDGLCFAAEQEGILHCLDAENGKEYWQDDLGKATWSSPYTVDGKVYMGSDSKDLRIYEHSKTMKLVAEHKMGQVVRATPVVANGVLYVMTENRLYAIQVKK